MRVQIACYCAALIASAGGSLSVSADIVTDWNNELLDGFRSTQAWSPPQLARAGAIVQTAVYDSINSITGQYKQYATWQYTPNADPKAAAAVSAHATLSNLFGSGVGNATYQAQIDARLANDLAAIPNGAAKTAGINLGTYVASSTLALRSNDGSNGSEAYVPGPLNPGDWSPNYAGSNPTRSVGKQYANVTPWAMSSPDALRPAPCPPVGTAEYRAAYEEVKAKGAAVGSTRTADETKLAWFWGNDRDGTFKPPGHYNLLARTVADTQASMGSDGSLERMVNNARLLALVNIAQADAGIAAWDCKYRPDSQAFWRPIQGIQNGDFDGDPLTAGDPSWQPLSAVGVGGGAYTPGFPAYTSGHATFGSATIEILRQYFGTDLITFSLKTDDADFWALEGGDPNATWTYTSLSQAEYDNAYSRIWLGVHWNFDGLVGNELGESVASLVYQNLLLVPGPGGLMALGLAGLVAGGRRRRA